MIFNKIFFLYTLKNKCRLSYGAKHVADSKSLLRLRKRGFKDYAGILFMSFNNSSTNIDYLFKLLFE